jgi:hypothetical protein
MRLYAMHTFSSVIIGKVCLDLHSRYMVRILIGTLAILKIFHAYPPLGKHQVSI